MLGPSQKGFNFADANANVMRGPQLFWFSRRHNRPEFAWYERTNGASSVLGLLWYDNRGSDPAAAVVPTEAQFRGDVSAYDTQDVVTMRGSWADPQTTFVGFKAGLVADSHGNLDAGSFVLDVLGQRWIHDLGSDSYALPGYFGEPALRLLQAAGRGQQYVGHQSRRRRRSGARCQGRDAIPRSHRR